MKKQKIMPVKYGKLSEIPEKSVDIKSNLNDWPAVKAELLKNKLQTSNR